MSEEGDLFERTVELPTVGMTDWTLLDEVFELLHPYADDEQPFTVQATDSRGPMKRTSIDALRRAVEQRGEEPKQIRFDLFGPRETMLHLSLWPSQAAYGRFLALDESTVTHVLTRVQEIFQRHARPESATAIITATLPPQPPAPVRMHTRRARLSGRVTEFLRYTGELPRWEQWALAAFAVALGIALTLILT